MWIDALCVIQDSRDNWERKTPNMGHVYASATYNVVATASAMSRWQFFRTRGPNELRSGLIRRANATLNVRKYHIFDKALWDRRDDPFNWCSLSNVYAVLLRA